MDLIKKAMKSKTYITRLFILLFSIGMLTGCDFYDVNPENGLKEVDYYRDRNDLNAGAFGIYAALTPEVHKFLLWGSARADMVTIGKEGADAYVTEFVNNNVTTLNPYTNYAGLYKTIARCNRQLEHIAEVEQLDKTMSQNDFNAYYGEAYFVRGLCYFYLVRTFQEFPLILEDISENITYTDENGQVVKMNTLSLTEDELRAVALKAADKQKVWEVIISDVKKAMSLLRTNYNWNGVGSLPVEQKYGRATLVSAYALACEVALWTDRFSQASAYADLVVNASGYDVGSAGTWSSQFYNRWASPYSMFLIGYSYDGSMETNRLQEFTSPFTEDGGKYLLKPAKQVVDSIFSDAADVRIAGSYKRIDKQDMIWKYIGQDDKKAMRAPYRSDASWNLIRTSDILLWKGIIENRLGNLPGAYYFLNKVRAQRGLDEYNRDEITLTKEEMEDLLFMERARELAFEGQRWYDLLFMETVLKKEGALSSAVAQKYPKAERAAMKTWLADESHWYLPIDPTLWK